MHSGVEDLGFEMMESTIVLRKPLTAAKVAGKFGGKDG